VVPPESQRIRAFYESDKASWTRWPRARDHAVRERRAILLRLVEADLPPLESITVCDVGCGGGGDLAFWHEAGVPQANLAGTELIPDRAAAASELLPRADIRQVDGFELPFPNGRFDLTTASLVFSSVLDGKSREQLFREMLRVTADDGLTVVYDMRIKRPSNPGVVRITPASLTETPPDAQHHATPLLPALAGLLSWPSLIGRPLIALLPRTHAVWIWRKKTGP
jgi:SAM-dependent methyltransferase